MTERLLFAKTSNKLILMNRSLPSTHKSSGFTIIELAVVILLIGILSSLAIFGFGAWQQRVAANVLKSDLTMAVSQLESEINWNDTYPETEEAADGGKGLPKSKGTSYQYTRLASNQYCLTATSDRNNTPAFMVSSDNPTPREGACPGHTGSSGDDNVIPATNPSCFFLWGGTLLYFDHEDNDDTNPACPRDVVIPSEINGAPITTIPDSSFASKRLTSVVIPDTVTSIGSGAFQNNHMTSVTIGNAVTSIGGFAFQNNQLSSITIPDSVTSIGVHAFGSNRLTSIVMGSGLTTIGQQVFSDNQLASIVIPDSITSIGGQAFAQNQLASVTIPRSVVSIGDTAFLMNQLTSVAVPTETTLGFSVFDPGVNVTRY